MPLALGGCCWGREQCEVMIPSSSGDISSVSLPGDVRCLQHCAHCWGRIASTPLMPGWSEGLDMRSRQGLASFGIKGEMQFSQPGRAVQSPFIFPLLCVEDAQPDLSWLLQENRRRGCRRPGTLTSARGLMKSKRELSPRRIHISAACAAHGLSTLLRLKHFPQGRGSAHKACLIRRCVGRMNSIPSEMEDCMSPPDGEWIFFFFKLDFFE